MNAKIESSDAFATLLTRGGLEENYHVSEVIKALTWADFIGIMCVIKLAQLAGNTSLALAGLNRLRARGDIGTRVIGYVRFASSSRCTPPI